MAHNIYSKDADGHVEALFAETADGRPEHFSSITEPECTDTYSHVEQI